MSAATTFADLTKEADTELRPWVDGSTPDGVFGVTTRLLGIITTYYFAGSVGDPAAPIIGRIELHQNGASCYLGGGLKGGQWMGHDVFLSKLSA